MNKHKLIGPVMLLALVLSATTVYSTGEGDGLTDPYEIYSRYLDAIGGLEALRADTTSYSEAEITLAGLNVTARTWIKSPISRRQEIDLKVFRQTNGDNGSFAWTEDANGQVQVHKDEESLKRREISLHEAEYEQLDPDSKVFKLTFGGVRKVGDIDCYVVKTTNTINKDSTLSFFNRDSFLMEQSIEYTPDTETHTVFSDYREVGGLLRAFHQEVNALPMGQKVTVQVTKFEPNVEIDPSKFEPPGEKTRDFRFTQGDRVENIPFEYIYGHIFINVVINCRERKWVLDSGAGISVIDSAFADELGLSVEGDLPGSGIGNTVNFAFTEVPEMSVKGVEFDNQTVAVLDLASIIHRAGMEASGILGYDFISRFVVRIDYANRTLSLYDPETFEYEGEGATVDAPLRGNILTLPVKIDGRYDARWQIDLGAGGSSIHHPFAVKYGLLDRPGVERVAYGAGGEMHSLVARFDSVQLAGFTLPTPNLGMPLEDPVGAFGSEEIDGNLGNDILRRFILYLDYPKQQAIFEKGADFDKKFPIEKTGVQIMIDDQDRYEVVIVSKDSPGDKAGFKKGDIVLAVNDIDVEYIKDLSSLVRIRSAGAGTKLKFRVLRDGEEKNLTVKLKDLFE